MTKFVFIWDEVDNLTHNWHDDGGLVVVAVDLAKARELIVDNGRIPASCTALTDPPDHTYPLKRGTYQDKVFVFPDAGCC